jgi:SecD/SecF fusion protein
LALAEDAKADKTVASDAAGQKPAPAVEKPAVEKPAVEKPADKPVTPPVAAEKPAAEKPAAEKPAAEKPAAEKPAVEKPAVEKPAEKPAAAGPQAALPDSFAGGTTAVLSFSEPLSYPTLVKLLETELAKNPKQAEVAFEIDNSNKDYQPGSSKPFKQWDLKIARPPAETLKLLAGIKAELADAPFFPSSNKIGATVADNTQQQAIVALLASILLIAAYVWFRFTQLMFGLAAILALFHDVLITLGALALSYWLADYLGFLGVEPFKINLTIIAAFLTIIGYSLNDTIVIFDRIREIRGKSPDLTPELVNNSINQTLSRTLLTSLTVFLVVLILYAVGGQGIHGFAYALVIGVITGTYSTVYIATPVLIWLNRPSDGGATGRVSRGNNVAATTR